MRTPAVNQIVKAMEIKGYRVFESPGGHDLNIVGIRSKELAANRFDDLLVVFYRRVGGWTYNVFPCTTDPGVFWLKRPMVVTGTAIMLPGQYRGAYEIGMHQGKYEALVQRGPVTVVRDSNRDARLDLDAGTEETGRFGINIHGAGQWKESVLVDKWSAGCQVLASWLDFEILMAICRSGAKAFGNSFTYTLLEEKDFGIMP